MISIHINHPDVLDFIKIKSDKTKVTGANISVRITDDFMEAVKNDGDFIQKFPIAANISELPENWVNSNLEYGKLQDYIFDTIENPHIVYLKRIRARELWDELIKQAKDNAEPGLMYWDRVLDYDPSAVYPAYKPITSNP